MPFKTPPARALVPAALTLAVLLCLALGLVPVTRSSSRAPQGPPDAQFGQAAASEVRKVALVTKDILVHPATQTLYASLPGNAGPAGNSVAPIDPATGAVGTPVHVGSEPNILAFSGDGQHLYVGLDGESAVRRFDLATQTAGLRVPLGTGDGGVLVYAEDIEVMPGASGTIAVARRAFPANGNSHQGVVIFDGDVPRPVMSDRTRSNNSIEFAPSGTTLYGYDKQTSDSVLRRLTVNASGVTIDQSPGVNLGVYGDFEVSNGFIYHSSGRVVNTSTFALAGQYAGMGVNVYYPARAVAVDEPNNRVYFITNNFRGSPEQPYSVTIWAYEKDTFQPAGTLVVSGVGERVSSIVRWGNRGLAFRDDENVYLVRTDLVPGTEPVGTPTPTPTPTPGPGDPTPTATPTPTPTATPSPSPTATPVPTPAPGEFRSLGLTTKDLVVDVNSQTIFASVPPTAGGSQNSVIGFDPATGAVSSSTVVGSSPNKLAISDDGQYVYVALDGESAVRRFETATRTAGLKFSLGGGVASDLSVMPGSPNTVAVSNTHSGVAVYDDAVRRQQLTHSDVGGVEFSNSPGVLYSSASMFNSLAKLIVGSCGVGVVRTSPGLGVGRMRYDNGRIYTSSGYVIDPEAGTLVGTFDVPSVPGAFVGPTFTTDSKAGRIYLVYSDGTSLRLRVFDMKTLVVVGELKLPGVTGQPTSLVRWGADGLAFRTDELVYVLQNPLVAAPANAPPFVPAPPAAVENFTVRGRITNFSNPIPGVPVNYSGARNGTTQTGADGWFYVADVPLCAPLTVTPARPYWVFTPSSVTITNPYREVPGFTAVHQTTGFAVTQTTASEGQHRVFLPVVRSLAPPYGAATLSYTVTPGTASERNDYTGTSGTFQFDPGVAQAPIEVLLTDDVFVEGPETFTVTLGNVQGMEAELVNNVITVTINDNDTAPPTTSPLQDHVFFVRRHYQDFLGRDPIGDPVGGNFWVNELAGCNAENKPAQVAACLAVKRVNVSAAFFLSIEFQQTGYLVQRLYAASFPASAARPRGLPRFNEFMRDTREVGRGIVVGQFQWEQKLEMNKQAFALKWVSRAEFLAEHPEGQSAGDYVDSLFANAGAQPTAAERAAAVTAYGAGDAQGRAAALRSVAESKSVFDRQFNRAFVLMQYFGYLRRDPDAAPDTDFSGYQFWLSKLEEFGGHYIEAEMVKAFITSLEYQQRFGPANFDLSQ